MAKKVLIIDFNLGNLFSVEQACEHVGISAQLTNDPKLINQAEGLILPGVGAFSEAMNNLESLGLANPIKEFAKAGKPIFGICLGQQLLFTESEEFGNRKGLDLIPGTIKKFPTSNEGKKLKVPQVGWNKLIKNQLDWNNTPLQELSEEDYAYFVHSFYVIPENENNILSLTGYEGVKYCSSTTNNKNIFATQFHPEKSGEKGLTIYKNWGIINNLI